MRVSFIVLLIQFLYLKDTIQAPNELLKVSIYYESLCPDSIRFINRQLFPAYQKIGSSLLIDFVPYGKATHEQINGVWKFECQHGPNECWGNKAQACGLAKNVDQDKGVDFVDCVMSQSNPASVKTIEKCAPELDVPSQTILDCTDGVEGDELLAKYGDQTHAVDPIITFVPTIIFNDKYDSNLQSQALRNFLDTACGLMENKPSGCSSN